MHLSFPSKPRWNWVSNVLWWLMLGLAVVIFFQSSRYLSLDPAVYFPEQKTVYFNNSIELMFHIVGAMLANIIGPFLFLPKLRSHPYLNLHRGLGTIYLLSVLTGGLGGLYMALFAYGGLMNQLGFMVLGVLWLLTGYQAYEKILNKQIELHRQWMIRNYALTYAGVMLRLWQVVLAVAGIKFTVAYAIVAWLSWIPNLLVAEWMIRQSRSPLQS